MTANAWFSIAVMAIVSYIVRVLPLTLIRKPINNQFIQSFLFYVPYVTLSLMVFPAIIQVTQTPIAGLIALLIGIAVAWFSGNLFAVALSCCAAVFLAEMILV